MADGALPQTRISHDQVKPDPTRALSLAAHQMSELIEQGALSIPAMRAIMWNTHGGSDAQGAWDWRAAYDCMEAGLLLAIKRDPEFSLTDTEAVLQQITRAEDLISSLPTQTRRSEDQMRMQQFSTPLPLALLMAAAADLGQGAQNLGVCAKQKRKIAEKEEAGGARGVPSPTDLTAADAAGLTVLEPSSGCGALAVLAQKAGCVALANELDPRRRALCAQVLDQDVYDVDAEFIANAEFARDIDRVLINPPFSSSKARAGDSSIALRHAVSAMDCLKDGGRMVAILPDGAFGPRQRKWLTKLLDHAQVRLHVALPRSAFAKSGTSIPTRLLVLDKGCGLGVIPTCHHVDTMAEAAALVAGLAPAPLAVTSAQQSTTQQSAEAVTISSTPTQPSGQDPAKSQPPSQPHTSSSAMKEARPGDASPAETRPKLRAILLPGAARKMPGMATSSTSTGTSDAEASIAPLGYTLRGDGAIAPEDHAEPATSAAPITQTGAQGTATTGIQGDACETAADPAVADAVAQISDSFASWSCGRINIEGAQGHPSDLVESMAMASVSLPAPKPADDLNIALAKRTVTEGKLSEAQLETLIMAETAFAEDLPGRFVLDEYDRLQRKDEDADAQAFRRGFFLGDGAGCGKGRQVAGLILSGWLAGRRKALWVSKSASLIEDAKRDWTDLGGATHDVIDLSKIKATGSIPHETGILFCTYATLRSQSKGGKRRLDQIAQWLGGEVASTFTGIIAFDEAHAMANAAGKSDGPRGKQKGSQQGRAGLELQSMLPQARVLYVSATGATEVSNLAYATRLGLWGQGAEYPFSSREGFVTSMEAGGVAAMEVVARDLKAMGLYTARALSFAGVDYDVLSHALTESQVEHYDICAEAFKVIHQNLHAALDATGINDPEADSKSAKSAAISVFESTKQRFFNCMLQSLKAPAIISAIKGDIQNGWAPVVQIVSTGEALLNRRIEALDPETELTEAMLSPKDYVLGYLETSFPIQQHQLVDDGEGNKVSRPMFDEQTGKPVICRAALKARDRLMTEILLLPAIPSFLDQLIWSLGTKEVAEITGRSKRPVRQGDGSLKIERRAATANVAETGAFLAGDKSVLVFTDAGGTGRSYHADPRQNNQKRRRHYLVEPGWRADNAIQGLGRTHRAGQVTPPFVRVCTTDVHGEKRFTSTIARRLDTLGALTKGQRDTASQGMFRPEDNLESPIARSALRALYYDLVRDNVDDMPLEIFTDWTALKLVTKEGQILDELPPIQRFLNRILALPIHMQNVLFSAFMAKIADLTERAMAAGTLDIGVETLRADEIILGTPELLRTCPSTGAISELTSVTAKDKATWLTAAQALDLYSDMRPMQDRKTGRVALISSKPQTVFQEDGSFGEEFRMVAPRGTSRLPLARFSKADWHQIEREVFESAWASTIAELPKWHIRHFALLTGMLLPLWERLPKDLARVYRLPREDAPALLGRVLSEDQAYMLARQLNPKDPASLEEQVDHVLRGGGTAQLGNDLTLRRSRVAGVHRLELTGASVDQVDRLKHLGAFTEIIAFQLRVFLPMGERGDTGDDAARVLRAGLAL
jgi:hypothetical protein